MRTRFMRHAARTEKVEMYKNIRQKTGKTPFGMPRRREYNIKRALEKLCVNDVHCIKLPQYREQQWAFVKTLISLRIINKRNFLTRWATVSFSWRNLLNGVTYLCHVVVLAVLSN
jgi:hypothetical protein